MYFTDNANIDRLPWSFRSRDLSSIQHVWDMVGRRINTLQLLLNNVDVLQEPVSEA